jgi:hypothetical protein
MNKNTPRILGASLIAGLIVAAGSVHAAGPTSTLYLTAGDQHHNWTVLGGTTTGISSAQVETTAAGEYAIAISGGVIRTGGNGQFGAPRLGGAYDLNFNYIGPRLSNPLNNVLDGTTDGTYNYGIDYTTGKIYRYNLDWSAPSFMFTAVNAGYGISYDQYNSSLWITTSSGQLIDYTMGGSALTTLNTPGTVGFALAFDPADGTLWSMTGFDTGTFQQYNQSGVLLQTINIGSTDNILGGEFALVPEPSTLSLAGLAALCLAARRRKRTPQA